MAILLTFSMFLSELGLISLFENLYQILMAFTIEKRLDVRYLLSCAKMSSFYHYVIASFVVSFLSDDCHPNSCSPMRNRLAFNCCIIAVSSTDISDYGPPSPQLRRCNRFYCRHSSGYVTSRHLRCQSLIEP